MGKLDAVLEYVNELVAAISNIIRSEMWQIKVRTSKIIEYI